MRSASATRITWPLEAHREEGSKRMLKLLKRKLGNEAGFTLMELIVVVLIVGILAAVGIPLYLGYVRDSRLAEAKALAGAALTAAQACAQNDPTGATCTLANLGQRIGVAPATGFTGDGRWAVAVTPVTLNVATGVFGGGPVTVAGRVAPVDLMSAGIFIDAGGVVTMHCNTTSIAVAVGDPGC
jgi:prepilin-type N-terminal cleavage/methylation domain-containing protein